MGFNSGFKELKLHVSFSPLLICGPDDDLWVKVEIFLYLILISTVRQLYLL